MPIEKLTCWEWRGLDVRWNLADGHARQSPMPSEWPIWQTLSDLVADISGASQVQLENDFFRAFSELNGQHSLVEYQHTPLYLYSSSVAIDCVASYLRPTSPRIALMTPTFDNLADILKGHSLTLEPVREQDLCTTTLSRRSIQALFLVLANNPTGWEPTETEFADIVDMCAARDILLILDFSFRMFSNLRKWDQYSILLSRRAQFIGIEDTGKFFSAHDLKIGLILSSSTVHAGLKSITDDILLNVSPLTLGLLHSLTRNTITYGVDPYIDLIASNAAMVERVLEQFNITPQMHRTPFSVLWCRLPRGVSSAPLARALSREGVALLPGGPFCWDCHSHGSHYIRLALMRDKQYVEGAAHALKSALSKLLPRAKTRVLP